MTHSWPEVALALIAVIPATIAALSSLRNGREQTRVKKELEITNGHVKKFIAKSPFKNGLQR
jgi:hypothetical protein